MRELSRLTRALLVGDWLAFQRHNVLEHMLRALHRGPFQADVQQVVGGPDILGKYKLRVGFQFLDHGRYLLRIKSCWETRRNSTTKRKVKRLLQSSCILGLTAKRIPGDH